MMKPQDFTDFHEKRLSRKHEIIENTKNILRTFVEKILLLRRIYEF
jgi:hypothetical protein